MPTIAPHSPLNISETVRDEAWFGSKGPPIGNGLCGIKWSRDRRRHVTLKGPTRDHNTLTVQYLENSWRCYQSLVTTDNLLWGSMVGYPSDSLAFSCYMIRYDSRV